MSAPVPTQSSNNTLHWWTLWAKWSSESKGSWHPLLCHLIDVSMCAEAMWDDVLSPAWKQRLAARFGLSEEAARAWVVYLAGLHDLGKACPGFQLQVEREMSHLLDRLDAAGLRIPQNHPWVAHGLVSARALQDYLPERFNFPAKAARAFAVALGGHHGYFPCAHEIDGILEDSLGDESWDTARVTYANWFAELFELPETPPQSCPHEAAVMFAGFVSVVDWIGSSETIFEHNVATPTGTPIRLLIPYRDHARIQARKALQSLGWLGWAPSRAAIPFSDMFPECIPPRPVQDAIIALADELDTPGLVIIEEQMGEGKTEAADYLADTWMTRFGHNGIYFGLPTQATSNQMFERISAFLKHRYPVDLVNLQLLHGHASLSDILQSMTKEARTRMLDLACVQDTEDGHPHQGGVLAASWFATGKRALLAPFGVGTVDQAMLSALQVKHFFVRMYGLTNKTIIIDEVHAYDTYMSEIIERLLVWLGALRVPVILLSATLPSSRRIRLLEKYGTYLPDVASTSPSRSAPDSALEPYPRISWRTPTTSGMRAIRTDPSRQRTVQLEWVDGKLPEEDGGAFALGERLRQELSDGGCCVVICNTVRRAQRAYQALKSYFAGTASDGGPRLDLFHARYPQGERARREARSLKRFGKKASDEERPQQAVLVATQVVEQSLDLDFDLMVSDHAPVDLLLQRSGRLHRHAKRPRPERLHTPRLLIIRPDVVDVDAAPAFERGSTYVYDEHILLTSWLSLQNRPHPEQLQIPDEIAPLIEATYETTDCPPNLSAAAQQAWIDTRAKMQREHEKDTEEAKNRYIKPPVAALPLADIAAFPKQEEDTELHPKLQALTRLTGPTVSVVCLFGPAERPLLDLGGKAISLKAKPDTAMERQLLKHSVTLSDSRVIHTLLEQQPPPGWQKSSVLNHHRALILTPTADGSATARVGQFTIRLDRELGIVIDDER